MSNAHDTIAARISDGSNRSIREAATVQFAKALADPEQWESAWTAVGGTQGFVDILAKISVTEVKALVKAIGSCNRQKVPARETAIEELVMALLPLHYPGSKVRSQDERPIQNQYAQMVFALSPDFVNALLDAKDKSNPLFERLTARRLIRVHPELLRKRTMLSIFGKGDVEEHIQPYLEAFVYREPPLPSPDPKVSESMVFSLKVLQYRLKNIDDNTRWPRNISEASILNSLLQRSIKKKLHRAQIHEVFILGLRLLEAKPALKHEFKSQNLFSKLLIRWRRDYEFWEEAFTLALRLELGGTEKTICSKFLQTSRAVKAAPDLRWYIFRLYCLHVPSSGFDVDTATDYSSLGFQIWSSDMFYYLKKEQAVRILKGLLAANPDKNFLRGPTGTSILSNQEVMSRKNFNASLLLTILQHESETTQKTAESIVDELRKKSATAKEQSDRASFAKAASSYAIASSNLDLYGETITWLQRFVRDPLTVKVVFGWDAVRTTEGVELLSGIPDPLPANITLSEIVSRVEKANQILIVFHESKLLAKREPSFHQPDWVPVDSLIGVAISERVKRATDFQKRLKSTEGEIYSAIWNGTLAMLERINFDSLAQTYQPTKSLLAQLHPNALAAAAKSMIEIGNERRKKKDRQPGDDMLESLSYGIILDLAKGPQPELARQLILQTILDRPDASSWHRQLLSVSYLNSLTAKDAHGMLLAFAAAIGEKLEEQSYVQVGVPVPPSSKPHQSLVKVTTVKYLAQMLDNAEFISEAATVEVLVELFKSGTHRDIRLATLGSLLSLLNRLVSGVDQNWRSNPLVEKILKALDTVIPIVGCINEGRPTRQEDWTEARDTKTVPTISDISEGLPPLLSAVLAAGDGVQYPGIGKNLKEEYMARYLLPILELSQIEHGKWVALFLAKHKASFGIQNIPPTPVTQALWTSIVSKYSDLIPQGVLEDFNKYIVLTIAPTTDLVVFNKKLKANTDISNTPEVQHWLSVYNQRMINYHSSGTRVLMGLVQGDWMGSEAASRTAMSTSRLQDMILEHASLFLKDYEEYRDIWNNLMDELRPPSRLTCPNDSVDAIQLKVTAWQDHGRDMLEKAIALVLSKKTEDAQAGTRSVLPSTTKLRLWLLPYPCFPDTARLDDQCVQFVNALNQLLVSLLEGETNVLRWPRITEEAFNVSKLLNTNEDRLHVAVYAGKLASSSREDQKSLALNFVRVGFAMRLIEEGLGAVKKIGKAVLSEKQKDLIQRLRGRIEEWQSNPDDEIRERVADWKREKTEIWKCLMNKEERK